MDGRSFRIQEIGVIGAETELDEGAGVRNDFGLPALGGLELLHRGLGACVPTPFGSPSMKCSRIKADWISRTRSGFIAAWPRGFFVLLAFLPLVLWLELDLPAL